MRLRGVHSGIRIRKYMFLNNIQILEHPKYSRFSTIAKAPKPLAQVRDKNCTKHYDMRAETACSDWIKRFFLFHGKRHPAEIESTGVEVFLSHLAEGKVSASTQNQALSALLFL